jgi:signal transduction histidine kinase
LIGETPSSPPAGPAGPTAGAGGQADAPRRGDAVGAARAAGLGVVVLARDGAVVELSAGCARFLGRAAPILSRRVRTRGPGCELRRRLHPDDLRRALRLWRAAQRGLPGRDRLRLRRADGRLRSCAVTLRPLPRLAGQTDRIVAAVQDLTGLDLDGARAGFDERAVADIASSVPATLFACLRDDSGRLAVTFSRGRNADVLLNDDLAGGAHALGDVLTAAAGDALEARLEAAARDGGEVTTLVHGRKESGQRVQLVLIARPRFTADGTAAWVGLLLDAEGLPLPAAAADTGGDPGTGAGGTVPVAPGAASAAGHTRRDDSLVGVLRRAMHDVKNYLQPIRMLTELVIARLRPGSRERDMLDQVIRACDEAAKVVRGAMGFARGEQSDAPAETAEPRPLAALVRGRLSLVQDGLPAGIRVELDVAAPEVQVALRPLQVYQLLANLVFNAADAQGGQGPVVVRIGTAEFAEPVEVATGTLEPGRYAVLAVTDRGPGIPPEEETRIFASGYTTKQGDNSGLGLPEVRNIAASHGGGVAVQSSPGAGTTMAVYLAASAPPEEPEGGRST